MKTEDEFQKIQPTLERRFNNEELNTHAQKVRVVFEGNLRSIRDGISKSDFKAVLDVLGPCIENRIERYEGDESDVDAYTTQDEIEEVKAALLLCKEKGCVEHAEEYEGYLETLDETIEWFASRKGD